MGSESFWLLIIAAIYALLAIKMVGKNERLIIFQRGKPMRAGGPGLVLIWPGLQSCKRVDMRPRSLPLPEIKLPAVAQSSIVSGRFELHIVDPLKAAETGDVKKATEQAIQSAVLSVVSNASIKDCLTESSILEHQVLELVNVRTKVWGVKVSALSFSEFRLHRQMVRQLAGLVGAPTTQVARLIEKVAERNVIDCASDVGNDKATCEHTLEYKFGFKA
jgi:regulator of protease activity HflC (stomatin/prohibitin superfamily)